jgi:hypothetical protein
MRRSSRNNGACRRIDMVFWGISMASYRLRPHINSLFVATLFLVWTTASGSAKYVVTGTIEGNVCSNYLIFYKCHRVEIKAVRGTDGKLYTVGTEIEDVNEFHEDSSLCFVRERDNWYASIKNWIGWIGYKLGYDWQESFVTVDSNGNYVRVDPEYLVFKCAKRE